MKKRQVKKKTTSKRINKNEKIKSEIRNLVLEAERMEEVSREGGVATDVSYWQGNANGLYEALCLINDGRW